MSINPTLNYILAQRARQMVAFAGAVTTGAAYLKCPGGEPGDGVPLPTEARILRIDCWDGTNQVSASGSVTAAQGDRLAVRATPNGGLMDVTVHLNGVATALTAPGAAQNATLFVTLHLVLI